jgi:hypothetical protein
MRPPTASAMCLDACFQRTLGVAPLPLAPTRPHMAIRATRDSNFGSGNHDMPGLSAFAYTSGSPIRALPTHLSACSQRILGVVPCALRSQTRHNNTITSPKLARALMGNRLSACSSWLLSMPLGCAHPYGRRASLAPTTSNGSWVRQPRPRSQIRLTRLYGLIGGAWCLNCLW